MMNHLERPMAPVRTVPRALLALGAAALLVAVPVGAQVCVGTPSQSSIAYGFDKFSVGSANGGSASLVGSRFAASLGGSYRSIGSTVSGFGGGLGLNGIIGASKFTICPGLTLGVTRDTWDPRAGLSSTINTVALGGGIGVGYSQEVGPVAVSPFVRVGYGFNLAVYQLSATNAETDVTGDTLSGVVMDYGVIGQYKRFYGGFAASRLPGQEGSNPNAVRLILGVTFRDRVRRP
jgi:hypothetical protein